MTGESPRFSAISKHAPAKSFSNSGVLKLDYQSSFLLFNYCNAGHLPRLLTGLGSYTNRASTSFKIQFSLIIEHVRKLHIFLLRKTGNHSHLHLQFHRQPMSDSIQNTPFLAILLKYLPSPGMRVPQRLLFSDKQCCTASRPRTPGAG